MAESESKPAVADAPQDAPAEKPATNGDVSIDKSDVETAGKEATTEVTAPDGEGTAEVAPAAASAEESASATPKDKKRKSSSGVPEHKTKKLNKKKSMPTLRLDCQPGELYWARLKGYPPWPSIICDEEMLPETLLASRPVSAARPDGSLREDFREGGKSAKDRTYPIMFLSTNEFAWLINTGLTPLDPDDLKPTGKLGKSLAEAYRIAAEKPDLDHCKSLLQQFQEETQAFEAEKRQREADAEEKQAAKAKKAAEKKARKSKGGDDEDAEMQDADAPKATKKRKKDAESDGEGIKDQKAPKIKKLNAPKTNGDAPKKPAKKKVSAPKDDDSEKQAPMSDAERLAHREKHVLYLRHKLQKAFLSRETAPKSEEMPDMADYFKQLEAYDDLEPDLIRKTKIHKVLKGIVKLDSVPRDDEFTFKKRSQTMLETWNRRMETDADSAPKASTSDDAPATNGESKEESVKAEEKQGSDKKEDSNGTNSDAPAEPTEASKEEPEAENAGEEAAAPDNKQDADGDVKMDDKAAGTTSHD